MRTKSVKDNAELWPAKPALIISKVGERRLDV